MGTFSELTSLAATLTATLALTMTISPASGDNNLTPKHKKGEGLNLQKTAPSALPKGSKQPLPSKSQEGRTLSPFGKQFTAGDLGAVGAPRKSTEPALPCIQPLALEKLFEVRQDSSPSAAPEGVFFIQSERGKKLAVFQRKASETASPLPGETQADALRVSPDGENALVLTGRGPYSAKLFKKTAGEWSEKLVLNSISAAVWEPGSQWLVYTANGRTPLDYDLFLLDLATLKSRQLAPLNGYVTVVAASATKQVALVRWNSRHQGEWLLWNEKTGLTTLSPTVDPQNRDAAFTHQGLGLFFLGLDASGHSQIYYRDGSKGTIKKISSENADVEHLALDPQGKRLVYSVNVRGWTDFGGWEIEGGLLGRRLLLPSLQGVALEAPSLLPKAVRGQAQFFFALSAPRQPAQIWFWNGTDMRPWGNSPVADTSRGCWSSEMEVAYASFDNTLIQGFLFEPRQKDAETSAQTTSKPRYLVLAHDGPDAQYRPVFDPQVQYLVQRGMAVLAPNIRGSTGYGALFEAADNGKDRVTAAGDLVEAGKWLIQTQKTQTSLLGVLGTSFGGWVARQAASLKPPVYAAAAVFDGVLSMTAFAKKLSPVDLHLWEPELSGPSYDVPSPNAALLVLDNQTDLVRLRQAVEFFESRLH